MRFIRITMRTLIAFLDALLFGLWLFRLAAGYKMWGTDFRVRQISRAPSRYLASVLRRLGAEIAGAATLKSGLIFDNIDSGLGNLRVGPKAYIGPGVFIDLAAQVSIEAEAVLAPQVMLLTHGDVGDRLLAQLIKRAEGPVTLKKGCWVGARAVILPGITVGIGAIIGAGAVVTADVPDYTVVAGVPARVIRNIMNDC